MAVRAVHHVPPPPLAQPGDVRQLVGKPAGHQQPPGPDRAPARHGDREPGVKVTADGRHFTSHHLAAVPAHLVPPPREQLGGRHPVVPEQPVHRLRRPVALLPGVDHEHRPARPRQLQRAVQPGGTAADHHHVVGVLDLIIHRRPPSGSVKLLPVQKLRKPPRNGK
jgi:hypothetical protein